MPFQPQQLLILIRAFKQTLVSFNPLWAFKYHSRPLGILLEWKVSTISEPGKNQIIHAEQDIIFGLNPKCHKKKILIHFYK